MKLLFLAFPFPGQLYGLEKFWAFLKYSKIKNQPIDPKLQEHLSQFKNLEDFRVVVSVCWLQVWKDASCYRHTRVLFTCKFYWAKWIINEKRS